jgi:hypothetical protein
MGASFAFGGNFLAGDLGLFFLLVSARRRALREMSLRLQGSSGVMATKSIERWYVSIGRVNSQ